MTDRLSADKSIRLELAGKLDPWRPISEAPKPADDYGPSWWIIGATSWGPPERRHYWSGPCEWQNGAWEFVNDIDVFAPPTHFQFFPAPPSEDKA